MKALLKKLTETYGPSGREQRLREVLRAELGTLAAEAVTDPLGNFIVRVNPGGPQPGGKRIMLAAHMDEIGLIAAYIDEKGFVRVQMVGGVNPLTCIGGRVQFENGTMGVVHVDVRRDDVTRVPAVNELFIDVGATSRADCPIRVGDLAGFVRPMAEQGTRLIAKSLDDRIGVVVLVETLRRLGKTPHEIAFAFTVQEEVGLRGAGVAAFGVDPDVGLAVDVTATGDTPNGRHMAVALGAGPAIKVRDARMLTDPRVKDWLINTAEAANLPYQFEILEGGSTDAAAIQMTRAGVPAGCVSIPARYIHSPSEMCDSRDVENSIALLVAALEKPLPW